MAILYGFSNLDDAYWFLNQAKGLPEIRSSVPLRERYVRACVVLSWVALEEAVEEALAILKKQGKVGGAVPSVLQRKLDYTLRATGNPGLSPTKFKQLRQPRNHLVHPSSGRPEPPLTREQAADIFEYCLQSIRAFFPFKIELGLSERYRT